MQLIKNNIERRGSGTVTLCPQEPEDMWHAYNLIRPNDILRASAIRRVTHTSKESGATSSSRVHLMLQIRVKNTDFDPQNSQLHVSGQIMNETQHTKVGQHHTLDLELHRNFTLEKEEGAEGEGIGWDSIAIEMLKDAIDDGGNRRAEAVAVVMQEGLAHICFITQFQTILKQKVVMSIPSKRQGGSDHDKGLSTFYQKTLNALLIQIEPSLTSNNNEPVRPILLASPGFVAAAFQKHIQSAASLKPDLKRLLPSIVVVHSASGHMHALSEVIQSSTVKSLLFDTKYARETKLMDEFLEHLRKDTHKATYGPREVESAVDQGAVGRGGGILIISNCLFRAQDVAERKRWVTLVDRVRGAEGGEVRILSSDHESGKRLDGLGGVAAILTFPITEEEFGSDADDEMNADGMVVTNGQPAVGS